MELNPADLKVFLNHIYEFKKGVRRMVLYTTNKKYEDFAVKRLAKQRIKFIVQQVDSERINSNASTCFSGVTNALKPSACWSTAR